MVLLQKQCSITLPRKEDINMRLSIAMVIIVIIQIGCSSSFIVSPILPDEDALLFSEFNTEAKGKNATIVFKDSTMFNGQDIFSQPDSTSFTNLSTGFRTTISTHKIKKIIFTNRLYGTLEGAGIGLLSGGGVGLLVGIALEKPNSDFPGLAMLVCSVLGGGIGLLGGTLSGTVTGHTNKYEFADQTVNLPSLTEKTEPVELDDAQKIALYERSKKSSGTSIPLSLIMPSAGHAYTHNWGRGLLFAAGRVGGVVLAFTAGTKDVYQSTPLGSGYGYVYNQQTEYTGWFYIGIASTIGLTIWEAIDASTEVDRYNERLSKRIIGEKSIGVNIVPSKVGPRVQFSYSF